MILDLFAGPGGWDEGARLAGYEGFLVGIEHDRSACLTAVKAGHQRVQADVATYPTAPFVGRVDGLIASPPCPSFSTAGSGGGKDDVANVLRLIADYAAERTPGDYEWVDVRSALTAQPMRWAAALRPRWVALEQVPPVLPIWRYLAEQLRKRGYRVWCGVLSAEEFGVPQTRKRAILVASLDQSVGPPVPTHQAYVSGREMQAEPDLFGEPLPPPVSMAEALGWGLPGRPSWTVSSGGAETGGAEVFANAKNRHTLALLSAARTKKNDGTLPRPGTAPAPAPTIAFGHADMVLMAPAGATSEMVDPRPNSDPAHTITGKGTAAWVVARPATTVQGDSRIWPPGHKVNADDRARFADADERYGDRAGTDSVRVTVVEAGVLQSFPADYPWQGTKTAQFQQVGNAVPPRLAAAVLAQFVNADSVERAA